MWRTEQTQSDREKAAHQMQTLEMIPPLTSTYTARPRCAHSSAYLLPGTQIDFGVRGV